MGLLLSILVGCVGVLELLASLKQVTNEVSATSTGPTSPCLSYHGSTAESPSFHDSLCSISHSGDIPVPGSARRKLENLHEYSLRVRSELRSFGGPDWSTLSDCSTRDLLSPSRADSRLSLNFDLLSGETEDTWRNLLVGSAGDEGATIVVEVDRSPEIDETIVVEEIVEPEVERLTMKSLNTEEGAKKYVRIPTPIPLGISQEVSASNSSLDVSSSFENESGNDAPTRIAFDQVPVVVDRFAASSSTGESSIDEEDDISSRVRKRGFIRISRSRSPDVNRDRATSQDHVVIKTTPKLLAEPKISQDNGRTETDVASHEAGPSGPTEEIEDPAKNVDSNQRRGRADKSRTSTVLRKPTRLKSKNAEISKSAENLTATRRARRHRDPERRRSDISVQTTKREESLRDEWTNTSPTDSEVSLSASRTSISVEVQTSFDDPQSTIDRIEEDRSMTTTTMSFDIPVIGLSESKRDVGIKDRDSFGRKAFRSRRFPGSMKSRSLDDYPSDRWAQSGPDVVRSFNENRDNRRRIDAKAQRIEDDEEANGWRSMANETWGQMTETSRSIEEDSVDEEFVDAEELIFSGEYTKAMNKDWHSGHFCCWQCDESLTGQRYVLRDEHPYCIKCYESVFANGCEECSKIIGIDSKDLSYKDKHWHEACFLCNKCRVSLVDKQFGSKVDKIYCGNCYDAQFASRCDGCGEIFRAGEKDLCFLFSSDMFYVGQAAKPLETCQAFVIL